MDATELQELLRDLMLREQEENEDSPINGARIETYEENGVLTKDAGILIQSKRGWRAHITIKVS